MTFDVEFSTEPMTLNADMGQVTIVEKQSASSGGSTDSGAAGRIMSENGDEAIKVNPEDGMSLVEKLETMRERGLYTIYVAKKVADNPPYSVELNSALRGICHISLTKAENGYMYAWILLFDKYGNMYTRYLSNRESSWIRYAIASE